MRFFVATLAALLLVVASLSLAAPAGTDTSPCCVRHSSAPIPKHMVKSYFYTSARCSLPSVVFIFKKGRQTCADPKAPWVKVLLGSLKNE